MTSELQAKKELTARVSRFIDNSAADSFEAIALDIFRFQYDAIPSLTAFWKSLGADRNTVQRYVDIPPVGLNVMKRYSFFAGAEPVRTFRTSGTSGRGRGTSLFDQDDLELMDRSILVNARQRLFPDATKTRFFMLVPAPEEAPEIIMAHGMRTIAGHFGLDAPFYAVRQGKLLAEESVAFLKECVADKTPVALIGGSFGFVNFIERLTPTVGRIPLPEGSRLLDAGGFKGRSRELTRPSFLAMAQSFFGLAADHCSNLYGLTELASQFYCRNLEPKAPPHWTRVRVCDPLTLKDAAPGEEGVALLYDLANVARPVATLTDDLARSHADAGFDLIGRASGSAPRGCSLSLENLN